MKRTTVIEIISLLFIILFVYAAVSKLKDFHTFRVQLGQSPMLTAYAGMVAWIIPTIEILIALSLTRDRYRIYGLYASFSLMTMFTAYIYILTRYSEYVPCSCGGVLQNMSWDQHLVFNIFFIALAAVAVMLYEIQPATKMMHTIKTV